MRTPRAQPNEFLNSNRQAVDANSILNTSSGSAPPLFDSVTLPVKSALFSMRRERTAWAGGCVTAKRASDSVEQVFGFGADGYVDFAAYQAFGAGAEAIIWYFDQSGNNYHRSIPFANNVILARSAKTGKVMLVPTGSTGTGTAPIPAPDGLPAYGFIEALEYASVGNSVRYGSLNDGRSFYTAANLLSFQDWYGANANSGTVYALTAAPKILRSQFDGSGATNALKGRVWVDDREFSTADGGSGLASTAAVSAGPGFSFNGAYDGSGEHSSAGVYADYWLPYLVNVDEWARIFNSLASGFLRQNTYLINGFGTSLTVGYNQSAVDPTKTPLAVLKTLLEARTGKTWDVTNEAEVGADGDRVLQLVQNVLRYKRDAFRLGNITVGDFITNEIAANVTNGMTAPQLATVTSGVLTLVTTLCNEFRAQRPNDYTFLSNCLPRTDIGALNDEFEVVRGQVNAQLAAVVGAHVVIVDMAGIPQLADSTNPTYYIDGVHLSATGYALMAGAYYDAIVATILGP